ncbi:MAG: PilZ domain-containing protein [Acidobacteria bacterium]|jgi:hypothetical protein|nr:PilZ domain-containing protein [Acidobacteriota bacterium]
MTGQTKIELHTRDCSCRGGSWVLLGGSSESPCSGADGGSGEKLVLSLAEWKQAGKPGSVEAYRSAQEREKAGERREFTRYAVSLDVHISRLPNFREPEPQAERTTAEVIAAGGALVRSMMAIDKGEIIEFAIGEDGNAFKTRSEVMYVSMGEGPGPDGVQRLGLKFLDAPLPESFIPPGAEPLP